MDKTILVNRRYYPCQFVAKYFEVFPPRECRQARRQYHEHGATFYTKYSSTNQLYQTITPHSFVLDRDGEKIEDDGSRHDDVQFASAVSFIEQPVPIVRRYDS
jgi:hypothetical protein